MNLTLHAIRRTGRLLLRHLRFGHPFDRKKRVTVRMTALETLFRTVNTYLSRLGVDYWLVDGTLLGYYREGSILRHDVDVDFGVAEAAYPALWNHRHLLPEGYAMYDTGYRHRGPKLYVAYKGWEADIYFYEDRGAELCSYENSRIGAGYSKPFPKTLFYPPRQAEFLGERTFVPNQCQAFLEHVFGYIGADAVQDKGTGYWRKRPEL